MIFAEIKPFIAKCFSFPVCLLNKHFLFENFVDKRLTVLYLLNSSVLFLVNLYSTWLVNNDQSPRGNSKMRKMYIE